MNFINIVIIVVLSFVLHKYLSIAVWIVVEINVFFMNICSNRKMTVLFLNMHFNLSKFIGVIRVTKGESNREKSILRMAMCEDRRVKNKIIWSKS